MRYLEFGHLDSIEGEIDRFAFQFSGGRIISAHGRPFPVIRQRGTYQMSPFKGPRFDTLRQVIPGRRRIHCRSWALCVVLACGGASADERPRLPASWEDSLTTGFPGLPADARDIAERAAGCLHFSGEIDGDGGERDREVAARMEDLGCRNINDDIASMRAKYPNDAYLQHALDLVAGE